MSGRSPPSRRVEVSAQGDDAGDVASDVLRKVSDAVSAAGRGLGRAGTVGFWVQLVLCTISAVVLVFSILFKGFTKGTDVGLYFILFGLLAGFLSCAWSFGYIRLGRKLMDSSSDPKNAPPRSQVRLLLYALDQTLSPLLLVMPFVSFARTRRCNRRSNLAWE